MSVFVLGVKQACCEFLESQLDPSNCLGIRDFAETHSCVDLMQAAEVFSQKHFPEVVQHEEFILLSQGEVEKLIKCDEIQVQIWLLMVPSSRLDHYKKQGGVPCFLFCSRTSYSTVHIGSTDFIKCPWDHMPVIGVFMEGVHHLPEWNVWSQRLRITAVQRGWSRNWKESEFLCYPFTHLTNIYREYLWHSNQCARFYVPRRKKQFLFSENSQCSGRDNTKTDCHSV